MTHVLIEDQTKCYPYGTDVYQVGGGDKRWYPKSLPATTEVREDNGRFVAPYVKFPITGNPLEVERQSDGRWHSLFAPRRLPHGTPVVRLEPTRNNVFINEMHCNGGKTHQVAPACRSQRCP